MKRALAIFVIVVAFHGAGVAASSTVYGLGAKSCGTWVEKRRSNDHFDMAQWMLGYISAAGFYGPDLRESEVQAFMTYLDNYCQQNPLQQFSGAVKRLITELKTKP